MVHSDFKEKFIRAEVISWQSLTELPKEAKVKKRTKFSSPEKANSWKEAKESGLIKTVGKEYVVHDGDVIEFKI